MRLKSPEEIKWLRRCKAAGDAAKAVAAGDGDKACGYLTPDAERQAQLQFGAGVLGLNVARLKLLSESAMLHQRPPVVSITKTQGDPRL